MIRYIKILFSLSLLFAASGARAQQVASTGFIPDARSAGFAGASVAMDAHSMSLYANMAATSFGDPSYRIQASYGYSSLGDKTSMHSVGGYFRLDEKHTFAVGGRYFMPNEIQNTQDGINFTKVKPYDLMIDFAYACRVNDVLALSVNARYINSKLNEGNGFNTASIVAVDWGLHLRKKAYSLAATISNLGMLVDYGVGKYRMPANLRVGGAYHWEPADDHKVTGLAEVRYNFMPSDYQFFSGGMGAEYMLKGMVAVRGGYYMSNETKAVGNYGAVGLGVYLGAIVADFSYNLAETGSPMNKIWRVTAGVRF